MQYAPHATPCPKRTSISTDGIATVTIGLVPSMLCCFKRLSAPQFPACCAPASNSLHAMRGWSSILSCRRRLGGGERGRLSECHSTHPIPHAPPSPFD